MKVEFFSFALLLSGLWLTTDSLFFTGLRQWKINLDKSRGLGQYDWWWIVGRRQSWLLATDNDEAPTLELVAAANTRWGTWHRVDVTFCCICRIVTCANSVGRLSLHHSHPLHNGSPSIPIHSLCCFGFYNGWNFNPLNALLLTVDTARVCQSGTLKGINRTGVVETKNE